MAQVAYDLDHFAPSGRTTDARLRVAKRDKRNKAKRERNARLLQIWRMMRVLLCVGLLVGLVSMVLYTQAAVTEVTTQIAEKKQELKDEESLNTYLSFTLDNKTSLKSIEEEASRLGMSKVDSSQISYFRVEEGTGIQVKEGLLTSLLRSTKNNFLSIVEYFRA